ncbi:MAG: serine hydrolase [Bdellovibrionales bacterium]|nr:serine hydrolase [Bdellovibrionales bacterium]
MITATLIGRTIQDGYSYHGQPVTLDTKLSLFFPNPGLLGRHPDRREQYERITLGHLVEMSAGFDWREFYDDDMSNSSFLPMLYLKGHGDMPSFALSQKLSSQGPGEQWNYSGGNANIMMGVLRKIHGESGVDANEFPKKLLFDELGLEGARVEQDGSGNFVGSPYVYMTTRDMAKVGQLYLQGGIWNGKRLLPERWTDEAQELVPTVFKKSTTVDYIAKLGAPSRRIFWLNRDIHRDDGKLRDENGEKVLYPREMPEAPGDLYFAAGHYGQVIAIVPSQNLIIARTGYDTKYWDHIQPLTVKALSCLVDGYKPNPVKTLVPPSAGPKKSTLRSMFDFVRSIPDILTTLNYSRVTGLAASSIAKEMCSFSYVSGAAATIPERRRKEAYFERSGMPSFALSMMTGDLEFDVDDAQKRISVRQYTKVSIARGSMTVKKLVREVRAELSSDPRIGCRLL